MQNEVLLAMIPIKRTFSKDSNDEKIVKIFQLGAELQLSVYHNGSAVKIIKLIIVCLQRFVLNRKVTLRTVCTYDQYLRTLFMERHQHVDSLRARTISALYILWAVH